MPKIKSSKLCIKNGDSIKIFMWALEKPDGDVYMGFPWESDEELVMAMEPEGVVSANDLYNEKFTGKTKLSFHKSGSYKLNVKMGKDAESVDRATVKGPELSAIDGPRHMAEVLLPEELPGDNYRPSDRDVIIDITEANSAPSRCTISCMATSHFDKFISAENRVMPTSLWEATHGFQTETHTWTWTLRKSKDDKAYANKVYVVMLGEIKWGVG